MDPYSLLWLIPLLPFVGAALNGLLGPRAPRAATNLVALGAPGLSLLLALAAIVRFLGGDGAPVQQTVYAWTVGPAAIDISFLLDPLSAVMLFIVTFVGFLIHLYSVGYMSHEKGYQRYFVYLNLFMGAMLLLILGANFLVTFVGWEGVGLCSYLLIGFYYDQKVPPQAGRKAFIVNRIGDFGFLIGVFALFATFNTLDYRTIFARVAAEPALVTGPYALGLSLAGFVCLCLFIGATGKSAQIPLYVWLPDAMAGPTPVSALIHAATMVTAGVYMVARSNVLFQLTPDISQVVAVIGAATAVVAATIAIAQTDIKKVLAYSTVSQLGYMFLAAGVGAYWVAIFHVATHAFFKALLFLGSGSVIHAMSGEQDMRKMGGLRKALPVTHATFLIATLAIAGVPGLAGFFSKDAILEQTFAGGHTVLWVVGLATAGLTACYMFRAVLMTFYGRFRGTDDQKHHLHESPPSMTVPLMVLAAGSVLAGYIGMPRAWIHGESWLQHFLSGSMYEVAAHGGEHGGHAAHHLAASTEWLLMILSVVVALAGILVAWLFYGPGKELTRGAAMAARLPWLHRALVNKWYVDEAYDAVIVRPLAALSRFFWKFVDTILVNGAIHVGAFVVELTGDLGRFSTTGNVRNYALYFFLGVVALFWWLLT
jgi:NADH-quinone oxidoreductase subunit L